jgi:FtsP/CotA-like multicopper oxidase with cupredoxin domain
MTSNQTGCRVWPRCVPMRWAKLASVLLALAALLLQVAPARAQLIPCPTPVDLAKLKLPEIVSANGVTRGMIVLSDAQQSFQIASGKCVPQLLRFFQNHEPLPPDPNVAPAPLPGPTIRAKLGDVMELAFLNQIDPLDYGNSIDRWENLTTISDKPGTGCDSSTAGYPQLSAGPPAVYDTMPNCFHGSSTGNLHFHGTHTSPQSTADNVFIAVRPSPRADGKPTVTEATVKQAFDEFYAKCEQVLKANNLTEWPRVWADLPESYTRMQETLLKAYDQGKPEPMQLWPVDEAQIKAGQWPQYYIGAFPNCLLLPKYPGTVPSHNGMAMAALHMGQSPGTHWYHAHKHGSTFLNVSNGMAGALIIEGDEYDGKFNAYYDKYRTDKATDWTRQQPTLVVNQLAVTPGLERSGGGAPPTPFSVNGEQQPTLTMYPGQVMLWRIVNASPTDGFYLPALPAGFTWRQTAQDGVQFDDQNYQSRAERPVFVAAGNRIDLLVQAPTKVTAVLNPINVYQGVSVSTAQTTAPTTILFTIQLAGTGPAMPLMPHMPPRPSFQKDITPGELSKTTQTLDFATTGPGGQRQEEINGHKFTEGPSLKIDPLNTVQEWTIKNSTFGPKIDHPFHIHLNPFQVVEVFDPNAPLLNNQGVPVLDPNGKPVPLYVVDTTKPTLQAGQCWLNPNDQTTWVGCQASPKSAYPGAQTNIWWDVFPIPAGKAIKVSSTQTVNVPGYFKLRSRFVDYAGSYVLHCHILAHEDRGMMMEVDLAINNTVPLQHH